MQHNENNSDQAARLHAFLIAAKFKLENLMNEERFKFIKEFEARGIDQNTPNPSLKFRHSFPMPKRNYAPH